MKVGTAPPPAVKVGIAPPPTVIVGIAPPPAVQVGTAPSPAVKVGIAPSPAVNVGVAPPPAPILQCNQLVLVVAGQPLEQVLSPVRASGAGLMPAFTVSTRAHRFHPQPGPGHKVPYGAYDPVRGTDNEDTVLQMLDSWRGGWT